MKPNLFHVTPFVILLSTTCRQVNQIACAVVWKEIIVVSHTNEIACNSDSLKGIICYVKHH